MERCREVTYGKAVRKMKMRSRVTYWKMKMRSRAAGRWKNEDEE